MVARTYKKTQPDVVAEVVVKHEAPERLDALILKLDQSMLRIAGLEATIEKQKATDDRPWTFDMERDMASSS